MCHAVGDTRYLLGRDVQRDCPEIHLLVSLDTGQYKKETCRMDGGGGKRQGCEYCYTADISETLLELG